MPIGVTIIAEEEECLRPQTDSDHRLVLAPRSDWGQLVDQLETSVVAFLRAGFRANELFVGQLKRAHRVPWSAVGPAVRLEDPDFESLARHLERFGPWDVPASPMALPFLPEGLTSYKTRVLKEHGGLENDEYDLQRRLPGRLFLDPTLEVSHQDQAGGSPAPLRFAIRGPGLSRGQLWRLRIKLWTARRWR